MANQTTAKVTVEFTTQGRHEFDVFNDDYEKLDALLNEFKKVHGRPAGTGSSYPVASSTTPPVPLHKRRGPKPKKQFKHTEAYLKKRGLLAKETQTHSKQKRVWSPEARAAAAERCRKLFSKKGKSEEKSVSVPRPAMYVPKVRKKMPANPKAFPEAAYPAHQPMFDAEPKDDDLKEGEFEEAPELG